MLEKINPRIFEKIGMKRCQISDCQACCCTHGVWCDRIEVENILHYAEIIWPHMDPGHQDPLFWFTLETEIDKQSTSGIVRHSAVIEKTYAKKGVACIFLRSDFRCALQTAANAVGSHPWRFKPFYCILHPLDLDDQDRITLDDEAALRASDGSCLQPDNRVNRILDVFYEELQYLLGDSGFSELNEIALSHDNTCQ